VGHEAVKADKTVAEITQKQNGHPDSVSEWARPLLDGALNVSGGVSAPAEPAVDLNALHAKIDQRIRENKLSLGELN
jgi:transposase